MKQVFEINTRKKLTELELLGCLEDTLGKKNIYSVKAR